jgi:8-oxo-dGTP pyrophosphatase MutT (NUDIX family)
VNGEPLQVIQKVVIYVIHRGNLLVFEHPDAPEAGLQVPAGSVRPGEDLDAAARREVREETGIPARTVRLLGTARYDMGAYGRNEVHDRFFYVAELPRSRRFDRRWKHSETHDGIGEPDVFELYWLPLDTPGLATKLEAAQGALLQKVM